MFELENAIANWRRQLAAAGVVSPDTLDELESHLREDIAQQLRARCDTAQAFAIAVEHIGRASALGSEFSKLQSSRPSSLPGIFRIACFVCAPVMWAAGGWALWDYEISVAARTLGLAGLSAIAVYVGTLPFSYKSLPSLEKPAVRIALKLLTFLSTAWTFVALFDALQIIHLHLGNILSMMCWALYTAFAFTMLGYNCRSLDGPADSELADNPSNFTELAQASLEAAREAAMGLHHDYIGTEHVLLGVLATESSLLADVFRKAFIDAETIRHEIEKVVGAGQGHGQPGDIPYTPRAKRAFRLAAGEARAMNQSFIHSEHLFLGLLLEGEGVAGLVLRNLGFNFERARAEIFKGFDPDGGPQSAVAA